MHEFSKTREVHNGSQAAIMRRSFEEIGDRDNRELLKAFRLSLRAENRSLATIEAYCTHTRHFMLFCEQQELPGARETSTTDLRQWLVAQQAAGDSSATVKNRYVACRAFFNWLILEEDLTTANPFAKIKQPTVETEQKRVLAQDDFGRLFNYLEKHNRHRDLAAISLLYDTGTRASETCNLLLENVNLQTGRIYMEAQTAKGRRFRVVHVSAQTLVWLNRYLRKVKQRRDPEYLITGREGRLTRDGLRRLVKHCFAEIGVSGSKLTGDGIGTHTMRHSSASHQARELSETQMMDIFGWRSADQARHYTATTRMEVALAAHERSSPVAALRGQRRR